MKNLLTTTAVLALLVSAGAAFAETTQTTVTQSPDATTQTTVTKSTDEDGNYTQYRKTITSTRHFDAGVWAAPSGYTVRHYDLGDRLPDGLRASNYYLTDYGTYQLVAPPGGTVWVRVGADAFLVRSDTGEIIQSDYGMFN